MVSYFQFELKQARCGPFFHIQDLKVQKQKFKNIKWPYLAHFSSNLKNKTTLFTLTFEVISGSAKTNKSCSTELLFNVFSVVGR